MDDDTREQVACMVSICHPKWSRNPVAWFRLEQIGLTREILQDVSAGPDWLGPPPVFENAPDRNSPIWQLMLERAPTAGPASGSAPARPPETAPDPTSAPTPQTDGTDADDGRR